MPMRPKPCELMNEFMPSPIQHWFAEYQAEKGQKHTGNNHHGEGISHDCLGFFDIPAPAFDRAERRAAHAKQVGKCDDERDDWQRKPDAGQR